VIFHIVKRTFTWVIGLKIGSQTGICESDTGIKLCL